MRGMKAFGIAAGALLLASCGGGGGGSGGSVVSPLPGSQAQGLYQGTNNYGYALTSVILENGNFYNITSGGGQALTVDFGNVAAVNYLLTGTSSEYTVTTNALLTAGILVGQYLPQGAMTATIEYNVTNIFLAQYTSFSSNYLTSYTTPATLAALAGTYAAPYMYGQPTTTFAINASGAITGTAPNCAISGTATPRASGMNVYDVTLTLTGANCIPAGVGTATGVAFMDTPNGVNTLYVVTFNSAGTAGFVWLAPKQ